MEPVKVSRADIRYQPQCKDLKDVICFPTATKEDRELGIKILTHYIDTNPAPDIGGGEGDLN